LSPCEENLFPARLAISKSWRIEPAAAFFSMSVKCVLRSNDFLLSLARMISQTSFAQSQQSLGGVGRLGSSDGPFPTASKSYK
jgi:hypothetical protein